jgi:hypothetical protein
MLHLKNSWLLLEEKVEQLRDKFRCLKVHFKLSRANSRIDLTKLIFGGTKC